MNQADRTEAQALIELRTIPEPNSGCWLWMAACDREGYGRTKWRGASHKAHRLSFEAFHGDDPTGLSVMHACDVPSCVNPAHLSLGTAKQNLGDASRRGRMRGPGVHQPGRWGKSMHSRIPVGTGFVLTQDALRDLVSYDPETGVFLWRDRPDDIGWSRKNAGKEAGWIDTSVGYRRIGLFNVYHWAHRLAWLYMVGPIQPGGEIDHINGDRTDNRWDNLRVATHAQNGHNVGLRRNNTSGVKGVSWTASRGKWAATITMNGRLKHLGRFDNFEDAVAARRAAEAEYQGAFARAGDA